MAAMWVFGGLLFAMFAVALVVAAVADRGRALAIGADVSRFAPPDPDPKLPWA